MTRNGDGSEIEGGGNQVTLDCSLPRHEQTRNILIFSANWALIYLSSPVTYVGLVQATLVDRLGFANRFANLPAGVFLWSIALAVVVTWRFPQVRLLKPLIV